MARLLRESLTLQMPYEQALERTDPAERAAFLDKACAGNVLWGPPGQVLTFNFLLSRLTALWLGPCGSISRTACIT